MQCICQIFLFKGYCFFKGARAYNCVIPSLFQKATCSYLVFLRGSVFLWSKHLWSPFFFKDIKLICNSCCSYPFIESPFFYYKKVIELILSNLLCLCRTGIVARRYHKYELGFRHAYVEKSLLYDDIISSHLFFYGSVIISRKHLKRFICQQHCVYFTALVAAIHYDKRSVFDSRKFEGYI